MNKIFRTPKGSLPAQGDPPVSPEAFPEIKETDLERVGLAAKAGDEAIADDFIREPAAQYAVYGGEYQLAGGLTLNVYKPLRVYSGAGVHFEHFDPTPQLIELADPDEEQPRVDLIYAKLFEDADGALETRFAIVDPADPNSQTGNIDIHTEKQNRIEILVLTGQPSEAPVAPECPADGTPLYRVGVPAAAIALSDDLVFDDRYNFRDLESLNKAFDALYDDVHTVKDTKHVHRANEIPVDEPAKMVGDTVQDVLNVLIARDDTQTFDPIFFPETVRKGVARYAEQAGKLGSVGVVDGVPAVDIPLGSEVSFFGSSSRKIQPGSFPATVENGVVINARQVNKHAQQATQSVGNSIPLSLAVINNIESDGGGTWVKKNAVLSATLGYNSGGRRSGARDGQYIEIFGMGGGPSWQSYDTLSDTLQTRAFSGAVPNTAIKFSVTCGNGKILIAALVANGTQLKWFLVNAADPAGLTILIPGAPGQPDDATDTFSPVIIGDLIQEGVVIVALQNDGTQWRYFAYHVNSNSFELLNMTGQDPGGALNGFNHTLCLYENGKAVIQDGDGVRQPKTTTILDYPTRTFTRLNIAQPEYGTHYVLANINGRPQLIGSAAGTALDWELLPGSNPEWRKVQNSALPPRFSPSTASLLVGGLPKGSGYFIGGGQPLSAIEYKDIWAFEAGGVTETLCDGQLALTLGPGATQATFRIDSIQLPWEVGKVVTNLVGHIPAGSVKVFYSFDGGVTKQEIPRDTPTTVQSSTNNPQPIIYVTLIGTPGVRPCISRINELFEQEGGPGLVETVIRFNIVTAGVRYLYIDRDGVITIEATAQESTPNKAILMKITPNGTGAPTAFDYVNKRNIVRKYRATRVAGATPAIGNDLSRTPHYMKAWLKEANSNVKDLNDPHAAGEAAGVIIFNQPIIVDGLAVDGESYIVELHA